MAVQSGRTLGKYRLGERIGRGGMAEVYKGLHLRLDRQVAIKVLYAHLMEGEGFLARFEREARAVAALRHPHIVQVYDFDVENETAYMVMEYVDGGSLKSRLQEVSKRQEYMPFTEVTRIMQHIGAALDHAHQQDMVHRDVKPSNVLLDRNGAAFLTDFGIVRIVSETQFTSTGVLVGTPDYMAPEQGRGESLTSTSDIYSLGVILYEMLVGAPPYDADTPLAVIHKHINDPLPNPRDLRPDLPESVELVVLKTLAKEPGERYQSAGELVSELQAAMSSEGETARAQLETEPWVDQDALSIEPGSNHLPPTVVMKDAVAEEDLASTVAMVPQDEAADGITQEDTPPDAKIQEVKATAKHKPEPKAPSRRKLLAAVLGGISLIAIVLAVVTSGVFESNGQETACLSVEECQAQARELMATNHFEEAINRFDEAAEMVPIEVRPEFADIFFARGEAFLALGLVDEGIESFEICLEWIGETPGFGDLRARAEEMLEDLRSR